MRRQLVGVGVCRREWAPATGGGASLNFGARAGCACRTDLNGDGETRKQDVLAFLNACVAADGRAHWDGNGSVNTRDVLAYLEDRVGC